MSAQAAVIEYSATLNGPSEFPVNSSPGIGFGLVTYDDVAHTLQVQVNFSGLQGTTSAATSTPQRLPRSSKTRVLPRQVELVSRASHSV